MVTFSSPAATAVAAEVQPADGTAATADASSSVDDVVVEAGAAVVAGAAAVGAVAGDVPSPELAQAAVVSRTASRTARRDTGDAGAAAC
jgi:hypothetical protein